MRTHSLSSCVCAYCFFFFSSRRRHTRFDCDWSSDVCSSDLVAMPAERAYVPAMPPAAPLTAEELLALPIPDKRVELVRGVLIVREPAGYAHGRVAMNLAVQLATHVESAAAGQVFAVETGFTLARRT